MKKPELKLGRRVIAWNDNDPTLYRGVFISNDNSRYTPNWVLPDDGDDSPESFDNVKPDPNAPPMNGDMVEVSSTGKLWRENLRLYIGKGAEGLHVTEVFGGRAIEKHRHVRFPQPSKREQVLELISPHVTSRLGATPNSIADQIDKIYTEDE